MTQIWILVYVCISLPPNCNGSVQAVKTYTSEMECEEAGLHQLHNGGIGMQGRAAVCLKAIR